MSPSALPDGEAAPDDGRLPASASEGSAQRRLGVYLHVPFCAVRCGYCDFNTYTAAELGPGIDRASYAGQVRRELTLAARVLRDAGVAERPVATVFVGGGTPTLLDPADLVGMLDAIGLVAPLAPDAEVTVEANPDSVTPASLAALAAGGVTRVSFGMQSAVRSVLAVLDRTHDPLRVPQVVRWAREAGLAVSLDLIYGTPGETLADWRTSVEAALACEPDHVSAYSLIVEDGTRLAARVRRGEVPMPDDDDLSDKYELVDDLLTTAGLDWYEVSNWARGPEHVCRHNLGYWRGDDWWGAGPGAHSHVGGVRWWNVKHPRAYAERLGAGLSPAAGRERLGAEERRLEEALLGVRLAEGLPLATGGTPTGGAPTGGAPTVGTGFVAAPGVVARLIGDGLVEGRAALERDAPRLVLTRRGRLLADAVVRDLVG